MDSVTALYEAHSRHRVVGTLTFDYGSKHNYKEIPFAIWHCERLGLPRQIVRLDIINDLFRSDLLKSGGAIPEGHYEEATMKQTVVPFRNGIMLAIAAGYAESLGARGLVIGAHAGDHAIYPDCREEFMRAMGDAIGTGTYTGVELLRPFIQLTKAQIAARAQALGVDLARTWSCYKGDDLHCGRCGTCVERREAFVLARLADPTVYSDLSPLPRRPGTWAVEV
jgi:7-cyano-7-deazaguanine synthase